MRIISIFSRDFRVLDNKLFEEYENNEIIPLFLFDEFNQIEHGNNLKSLFFKTIEAFEEQLKKLNSYLYKINLEDFGKFLDISKPDVVRVCYDGEPRTLERLNFIEKECSKRGIKVQKIYQFLIEPKFEKFSFSSFLQFYKKIFKNYNFGEIIHKPKFLITPKIDFDEIKIPKINNEKIIKLYFKTEEEVLKHFEKFKQEKLQNYSKLRDYPYLDWTSKLSVYFRMGQISYRYVIKNINDEKFLTEVAWSEFYRLKLFYNKGEYEKWQGFPWNYDQEKFNAWKEGRTGYLIVDAGMRQLIEEGFIHNRVRMICASFLIKNLHINWKLGERWFYKNLVDADLSSNLGNWFWVLNYIGVFNPIIQQQKFDPNFEYIRKYIPNYQKYDYKPIVDFYKSREVFITKRRTFHESC